MPNRTIHAVAVFADRTSAEIAIHQTAFLKTLYAVARCSIVQVVPATRDIHIWVDQEPWFSPDSRDNLTASLLAARFGAPGHDLRGTAIVTAPPDADGDTPTLSRQLRHRVVDSIRIIHEVSDAMLHLDDRRPGTRVISEHDHLPFTVGGHCLLVRELRWNAINGRSYELVLRATPTSTARGDDGCVSQQGEPEGPTAAGQVLDDEQLLTMDSAFDTYPTEEQIADLLAAMNMPAARRRCALCGGVILADTAHRFQDSWVGHQCCWNEDLHSTT